jgi:hypothetical protein
MSIKDDLSTIVETMSDGFEFAKLKFQFEKWEEMMQMGDPSASQLLNIVHQFSSLCRIIKKDTKFTPPEDA